MRRAKLTVLLGVALHLGTFGSATVAGAQGLSVCQTLGVSIGSIVHRLGPDDDRAGVQSRTGLPVSSIHDERGEWEVRGAGRLIVFAPLSSSGPLPLDTSECERALNSVAPGDFSLFAEAPDATAPQGSALERSGVSDPIQIAGDLWMIALLIDGAAGTGGEAGGFVEPEIVAMPGVSDGSEAGVGSNDLVDPNVSIGDVDAAPQAVDGSHAGVDSGPNESEPLVDEIAIAAEEIEPGNQQTAVVKPGELDQFSSRAEEDGSTTAVPEVSSDSVETAAAETSSAIVGAADGSSDSWLTRFFTFALGVITGVATGVLARWRKFKRRDRDLARTLVQDEAAPSSQNASSSGSALAGAAVRSESEGAGQPQNQDASSATTFAAAAHEAGGEIAGRPLVPPGAAEVAHVGAANKKESMVEIAPDPSAELVGIVEHFAGGGEQVQSDR